MRKSVLVIVGLLILVLPVQGVRAENLAAMKKEYKELSQIVNNPNVLWLPASTFFDNEQFMKIGQFKDKITKNLLANPRYNTDLSREFTKQYVREVVQQIVTWSNAAKRLAKKTLLPQLAANIKQLERQEQQERNRRWRSDSAETNSSSDFSWLTDPQHLDTIDFSKHLGQESEANAEGARTSCPKFNPQSTRCWLAYANGRTGGKTYTQCCYFGGTGSHILSETPYIRGKKDGTSLRWSKHSNSYYFSERKNWKNDKLHGIVELHTWIPQIGGPFLSSVFQYSQGEKSGHSVQYQFSGERTEINWLNGVSEKIQYYNKDGFLRRCGTKDHSTRRWRDCTTGRLW